MATFTNVSGEDRDIPVYNLFVLDGADFDVPDDEADGLRAQEWCTEKTTAPTVTPTVTAPVPEYVAPTAPTETVTAPVDAEQGVN